MKKIELKFSKNSARKLISIILKYRYLLFFVFFSASLALTFRFMYKYIYVDANFLEYEESYESRVMLDIKTNDRILKEISKNIEQRNERLKEGAADYNNPFRFINSDAPKTSEADNYVDNNVSNNGNNNLISPPPLNTP